MRPLLGLGLVLSCVVACVVACVVGCSSSSTVSSNGQDGAVPEIPEGGIDSRDAGVEGGSATSDPGNVRCGGRPCDIANNYCCADVAGAGEQCVFSSVSSCAGDRLACDEAADCPGGSVCCSGLSAARPLRFTRTTSCATTCFSAYQMCKTDAECADGAECTLQVCRGVSVTVCGVLPAGACD